MLGVNPEERLRYTLDCNNPQSHEFMFLSIQNIIYGIEAIGIINKISQAIKLRSEEINQCGPQITEAKMIQ